MALTIGIATLPEVIPKRLISSHSITPRKTTSLLTTSAPAAIKTSIPSIKTSAPAARNKRATSTAPSWREIQGSDDWENLVEPLNPLLRGEIIRYGEFVMACYKAFDLDPTSKRYLNCKYGKKNMLRDSGLPSSGYEITKYIYATPDIPIAGNRSSRWMGYVAVSSDETSRRLGRRDILVSLRGTVTSQEWVANLMSSLTPARLDPHDPRPDVQVESGFLSLYTSDDSSCRFTGGSCRQQLLSELSRQIKKYSNDEMSVTLAGHSMGSALALLLGYDLAELGMNRDAAGRAVPLAVFSFGGPRVGNLGFKQRCDELGVKVLRVVNVNDPVTKLPGIFLNENSREFAGRYGWSKACYAHVGVEVSLDFFEVKKPTCVHDLDAYIGLLKCPRVMKMRKEGEDLVSKVRRFLSGFQGVEGWQGVLVQSILKI